MKTAFLIVVGFCLGAIVSILIGTLVVHKSSTNANHTRILIVTIALALVLGLICGIGLLKVINH